MGDVNKVDLEAMFNAFVQSAVSQAQLDAVTMPTLPRIVYIDAAFTGNIFPYFSNWASARAALLALVPAPDVTHPAWATRFSAADGTQIDIGGDTESSLAGMGIILRDGRNGTDGIIGRYRARINQSSTNDPAESTVLINTLGDTLLFGYTDVGQFSISPLSGSFLGNPFMTVASLTNSKYVKLAGAPSINGVGILAYTFPGFIASNGISFYLTIDLYPV
jgi:hypothetical protein